MYKVERIVLKGFAALGLHGITEFDFSIKTSIMILLGGNGCGKSSFLDVYFPLCPAKTDFRVGGSYLNVSEIDGIRYRFTYRRTDTGMVCGIKNLTTNEDIVHDVNPKVYNARVEDITKLNREIVDLINGRTTLTRANSTVRRQWFTKLSTTDLTYGLGLYQRLRGQYRNTTAVIEHISEKISQEKLYVVESEREREAILARLAELELQVSKVMSSEFAAFERGRFAHGMTVSAWIAQYRNTVESAISTVEEMPAGFDISEDRLMDCQSRLDSARAVQSRMEGEIAQRNRVLGELADAVQRQQFLMRNHEGLAVKIEESNKRLDELTAAAKAARYPDLYFDEKIHSDQLEAAKIDSVRVLTRFSQLLDRTTGKFKLTDGKAKLDSELNRLAAVNATIANRELRMAELKHNLKHFDDTELVACPQCSHSFKPGVVGSREEIVAKINEHEAWLHTTQEKLVRFQIELDDLRGEVTALEEMRELLLAYSSAPAWMPLLKSIYNEDLINGNRNRYGLIVGRWPIELDEALVYRGELQRNGKLKAEWETAAAQAGSVDGGLMAKLDAARAALDEATLKLDAARCDAREAEALLSSTVRYRNACIALEKLYEEGLKPAAVATVYHAAFDRVAEAKQTLLDTYSECRSRWNAMESRIKTLEGLEREHAEQLERKQTIGKMLDAWSPERGVLRKYFYNAIVRITDMMNRHIRNAWSYPMHVLPCDIDGGDMDYSFPYQLKDLPEPVADVGKCSDGQAKMFNLAFRLTAYKALGLEHYPLLLDEPEAGLDEVNRGKLVDFIKRLSDSGNVSQLIVISHNSDVHSKLNNASYCVIEPEGVTLPEKYNDSIRIIYEGDTV